MPSVKTTDSRDSAYDHVDSLTTARITSHRRPALTAAHHTKNTMHRDPHVSIRLALVRGRRSSLARLCLVYPVRSVLFVEFTCGSWSSKTIGRWRASFRAVSSRKRVPLTC